MDLWNTLNCPIYTGEIQVREDTSARAAKRNSDGSAMRPSLVLIPEANALLHQLEEVIVGIDVLSNLPQKNLMVHGREIIRHIALHRIHWTFGRPEYSCDPRLTAVQSESMVTVGISRRREPMIKPPIQHSVNQ